MLSHSTKRSLAIISTLMYISSSMPIHWDKTNGRVKFVASRVFRWTSTINYIVMVLFEFFLAVRCYQVMVPAPGVPFSLSLVCHMLYTLACYAIPVHLQTNTLLRWKDIPLFINGFMDFFRGFKENKMRGNLGNMKNGCERLCKVFLFLAAVITLQNCVLIMKKPERPFFLTSLLPDSGRPFTLWRVLLVIVHLHIWLSFWAQLLFYGLTQYMYAFPCLFVIKMTARPTKGPKGASLQLLRQHQTSISFMQTYRSLQVLHNMFHYCYGIIFLPGHKVTMATSVVFSIYGAIKLHGNRAILMAFVSGTGLLYLSILFWRLGEFYMVSSTVLNSWRRERRDGLLRRFLRSAKPIQVTIGSYYPIRSETVMSLMAIVMNSAINMLLSF